MRLRRLLVGAALAAAVLTGSAYADPADVDALLAGVNEIVAPGCVVGPVAVFGEQAFPVVTGASGGSRLPILAAARWGRGRVVLAGHEGLFGTMDRPDQRRLITNIASWLAADRPRPARVLVVDHRQVAPVLKEAGFRVRIADVRRLTAGLSGADVLFLAGHRLTGPSHSEEVAAVARFVEEGGGFCDGLPGWGWLQLNSGQSLAEDYGGNRLTARMGLAIADGWLEPTGREGWLADRSGLALSHAGTALSALEKHALGIATLSKQELLQVSHTLAATAAVLPPTDRLLLPRLRSLLAREGGSAVPTPKQPLGAENAVARLACVLQNLEMRRAPVEALRAHPAAEGFPGPVPRDAPRVTETVQLDTSVPDWHSTGLYAAPGEALTITLPERAVAGGLGIRIGSHTDTLWHHERWSRFPEISYAGGLTHRVTLFGSPFGGIVYLTVPRGCRLGKVSVTVAGAVRMPYFLQGVTHLDRWRSEIRHYAAPWAELATRKVILTLPASVVRGLDDPEALLWVWDAGMDAIADLAAMPRERERPERICCDQQISAGYMHSGYPIMTFLDVPPVMVDRDRLISGGARVC